MTNNHKMLAPNTTDDSNDGHASHIINGRHMHNRRQQQQQNCRNLFLMKIKSKSSTNIDDGNHHKKLDDDETLICSPSMVTMTPEHHGRNQYTINRPQTTTGIGSRRSCSRLKRIFMFGHCHPEFKSSTTFANCDLLANNNNLETITRHDVSSISDLESLESLSLSDENHHHLLFSSLSPIRRFVSTTKKSFDGCSSPSNSEIIMSSSSAPTSPKIMISSCHLESNDIQNSLSITRLLPSHNSDNGESTSSSKSIVRIIKPMARHPSIHYDPPRPSTSVDVHLAEPSSSFMASASSDHSSAFHQVIHQHCRSNSLSEPLVTQTNGQPSSSSNPYSNPLSMESIEQSTDDKDWKISLQQNEQQQPQHEPIHMTLEEVRRIAFGSPKRFTNNNNNNNRSTITSTSMIIDSSKKSPPSTSNKSIGGNGLQNAKTKIKNFVDNLLKTTPCMGIVGGCTNDYSSSASALNSNTEDPSIQRQRCSRDTRSPMISGNTKNGLKTFDIERNHRNRRRHRQRYRTPVDISSSNPLFASESYSQSKFNHQIQQSSPFIRRALPPVPAATGTDHNNNNNSNSIQNLTPLPGSLQYHSSLQCHVSQSQFKSMTEYERQKYLDYVSSIERVKNCGWYWGPISGEMAEKLLNPEPCGSFLVRDSSDEHYIFSLSFKLDGMVRHVRIEQEQGNFSFGSLKKFRSSTIVDFIESAMEHSRSGQFLFFLRLGPELGPIRVQLLHPVSRFKQVQSLQHICRFVILQYVRRDQIHELALPEYLRQYLDTPYYYSEELARMQKETETENEEQRWLEKKRKFFLQTDYKTLLSKMLINRENLEQKLSIRLSNIEIPTFDDYEHSPLFGDSEPNLKLWKNQRILETNGRDQQLGEEENQNDDLLWKVNKNDTYKYF